MKQLDKVELFVCSEDNTSAIGFADRAEVWTEGDGTAIILRGINGDREDLLQAENECLRRDVEFYKNRRTVERTIERQLEIDEREFIQALEDYAEGRISHVDVAEVAGVALVESEPTDEELLAGIIRGIDDWQSITSPELLAKYLNTAGVTAPKEDN